MSLECGVLSELRELHLNDNSNLLGPLPGSFTNLNSLVVLRLDGTGLCAPTDTEFQAWLRSITDKRGVVNCADCAVAEEGLTKKLYWTDAVADSIQWADLDEREVEVLVTGVDAPQGIALDRDRGKMYWTLERPPKIQRSNLDGSGVENLITKGVSAPYGLALDLDGGKMYWSDIITSKIQRANLDGSGLEDLITTGLRWPYGLALDLG